MVWRIIEWPLGRIGDHQRITTGVLMSDTKPTAKPTLEGALVDIQTLASFALRSGDQTRMKRDLETILTITEMVLPPKKQS